MKDEFDYKYELLLKEIDILQSNIRSYDSIIFTIKGWCITIFSGFLFFSAKENQAIYLFFAALAVVLFWTLDATFKGFQRKFIVRYNRIEHFFRAGKFDDAIKKKSFGKFNLPDVGARFSVSDAKAKTNPFRAAFFWHTAILYVAMLVMLIAVASWIQFGK